jgi:hypothetical protein
MAAVARKQEVITHLTTYYSDLTDDDAGRIYDEAMNLYHESLTYTMFLFIVGKGRGNYFGTRYHYYI